jgi:hypothetical protein
MVKQNNLLTFLTTACLVAITGQSAFAFTINFPPLGKETAYKYYRTENYYGYTWLKYLNPVQKNSSEQTQFLSLLNDFSQSHGGNWQFEFAQNDLNGSYDFDLYRACGIEDSCGKEITNNPNSGGVGSEMLMTYNPVDNDPKASFFPQDPQLYWIQRVRNNHPGLTEAHGEIEDKLDVSFDNIENPYFLSARSYGASDAPFRGDFVFSHFWDAELYLAQETREGDLKKVTIYNGVEWGWRNETFGRDNADICKTPDISDCINNPPNTPIDLAFVFDTTGSMGSYLNGMKTAFKNLAQSLFEQVPGTRIAVVDYKDFPLPPFGQFGDYPYRADLAFSSDITSIDNAINQLTVGGGGDIPESLWSALTRTMETENLNSWRDGVKKGVIYLTDAFAHDPEPFTGYTVSSVVDESFHVDPVRIYGIVPNYLNSDTSLARLSSWTGGKLLSANSSNDVILKVIEALTDINGAAITSSPIPSWYEYGGGSGGGGVSPHTPDLSNYDNSKSSTPVPESTSVLGLLALSAWAIMKALKIRQSQ